MMNRTQTAIDVSSAPVLEAAATGTVSMQCSSAGACVLASPSPLSVVGEYANGPLLWSLPLRVTAVWELGLIAILLLTTGVLVASRLADAVADRKTNVADLSLSSESPPNDDATHERHTYEDLISSSTPPELLSDRGRVVRILVENGGRVRQRQIVEETGWSKSKVSRLLSKMQNAGQIEKVSVGRENVVVFPDERSTEEDRSADVLSDSRQ